MFAVPGILLLIAFIYLRPQEFLPTLTALPLLYLFVGLALFGLAVDYRLRVSRPIGTPQLPFALLFFAWCLLTVAVRAPALILAEALPIAVAITLYVIIGHGVQTFRAFQWVAGLLLVIVLFLAVTGIHQGAADYGCHVIDMSNPSDLSVGVYDGRPCDTARECFRDGAEPGADYLCERVGWFGTSSIGHGRVRYLGTLQDPNELALVLSVGMPFAFAFFAYRRSGPRLLLTVLTVVAVAACAIFTQSRGGQLVFAAVLGTYFVRRYGVAGLVGGALLALPLLLFGGRSGEEAESSSIERLECWYEGMSMFVNHPGFGVGAGQFTEHHFLTAHNSYVLAPAELGFVGMCLFMAILYLTLKIPLVALLRLQRPGVHGREADIARAWAMALLASLVGLAVGIFFLSFCYKQMLWIYFGVSGAFYLAMKRHDPEYEVTFKLRDAAWVVGASTTVIFLLFVYTRYKAR
jgi:hypothetical protein